MVYYTLIRTPHNSIGNHLGTYIRPFKAYSLLRSSSVQYVRANLRSPKDRSSRTRTQMFCVRLGYCIWDKGTTTTRSHQSSCPMIEGWASPLPILALVQELNFGYQDKRRPCTVDRYCSNFNYSRSQKVVTSLASCPYSKV